MVRDFPESAPALLDLRRVQWEVEDLWCQNTSSALVGFIYHHLAPHSTCHCLFCAVPSQIICSPDGWDSELSIWRSIVAKDVQRKLHVNYWRSIFSGIFPFFSRFLVEGREGGRKEQRNVTRAAAAAPPPPSSSSSTRSATTYTNTTTTKRHTISIIAPTTLATNIASPAFIHTANYASSALINIAFVSRFSCLLYRLHLIKPDIMHVL